MLAFTPLYLKLLGVEAYGLIGFYSTLLAMLAFADMGFTATLTREIARFDKNKKDENLNKYALISEQPNRLPSTNDPNMMMSGSECILNSNTLRNFNLLEYNPNSSALGSKIGRAHV